MDELRVVRTMQDGSVLVADRAGNRLVLSPAAWTQFLRRPDEERMHVWRELLAARDRAAEED